jgi:hypothetical protein
MSRYIVSEHPQGTPGWFKDRLGFVTGSVVKAVFATIKSGEAAARADLRVDLCLQLITGDVPEQGFKSLEMIWGTEKEPLARLAYEMATGNDVEESGFVYLADGTKAGCSVDGFTKDGGRIGLVEFKCPKSKTHWNYIKDGKAPAEYMPQIVHNLWITGAEFCDFMSFDPRMPEGLQTFLIRVERDEAAIQAHAAGVMEFLETVKAEEASMRARMKQTS